VLGRRIWNMVSKLNVLRAYLLTEQKANATPKIAETYVWPTGMSKNIQNQAERKQYATTTYIIYCESSPTYENPNKFSIRFVYTKLGA
jgi:hypothetical protein